MPPGFPISLNRSINQSIPSPEPARSFVRILYVEDNRQLRESISVLLQGEQRQVVCCVSAEEARELDAQGAFDLIITDVTLPGMSGIELCTSLLADDPERWVVLCTGHHMDEHSKPQGANVHLLIKPFGVDELESLVDAAAQGTGQRT